MAVQAETGHSLDRSLALILIPSAADGRPQTDLCQRRRA